MFLVALKKDCLKKSGTLYASLVSNSHHTSLRCTLELRSDNKAENVSKEKPMQIVHPNSVTNPFDARLHESYYYYLPLILRRLERPEGIETTVRHSSNRYCDCCDVATRDTEQCIRIYFIAWNRLIYSCYATKFRSFPMIMKENLIIDFAPILSI